MTVRLRIRERGELASTKSSGVYNYYYWDLSHPLGSCTSNNILDDNETDEPRGGRVIDSLRKGLSRYFMKLDAIDTVRSCWI